RDPEILLAGTDDEAIVKVVAPEVSNVADADEVPTVSRHVEQNLGIAAEPRAPVVVAVVQRYDRHAVGRKRRAWRMNFDFVRGTVDGVRLWRRAEITEPQASLVEILHVFVRPERKDLHFQDFIAKHHQV